MPSQLTAVFFVPTKREWLWINKKQEEYGVGLNDDNDIGEKQIKIAKTYHKDTSLTKSFFGFGYAQARADEKTIILNYFDSDGIQQQVGHAIKCSKKGDGDFQIRLSTRNLPPLWKSKSDGGFVANEDDLLPVDEIENANYDDRETSNGIYWPEKTVLWFGKCEATGEFWHGVLNDENIDAYDEEIREIYESMCDSRGVRRGDRTTAVVGDFIKYYRGPVEGNKVRVFDGAKLETQMSTGVLEQIKNGETNILLYGPPGTGKTYALQELRKYLNSGLEQEAVTIDVSNPDAPLQLSQQFFTPSEMNMPGKIRVWWTTFHQGVTYEDFVVGLRPKTDQGGITLEPRAGILLQAMHHAMGEEENLENGIASNPNTSVIIIDELNRGNVEAILGDFITAMDKDYRAQLEEGVLDYNSKMTIPMIFNNINGTEETHPLSINSKNSQPILFASDGTKQKIPLFDGGYIVPQTVIIIGTMNSVDRSIKPLDNALERRFVQVRCDPDPEVIRGKAASFGSHLLKIANECIRDEFPDDGEDKTIGHSLMMKTKTKDLNSVEECYEEWRKHVIPVLIKRFRGKHVQLRTHLQKKLSLFKHENLKEKLPNDASFGFKSLIGKIKIKNANHRLCQFVLEMHEGEKKGKETISNLIENDVLENTLFKKGEDEQVLIIQDDTVEFSVKEDDGTITQTTIEENDWDDWKSVYTEKSLKVLMESESEDDEEEEVAILLDDLTQLRVESDIVLLGVTKTEINQSNESKRLVWRGHLDEITKQLFDEAVRTPGKKASLKNYQKDRGSFWLNRLDQVVEDGDLSDAERRLALQAAEEYLATLPAP